MSANPPTHRFLGPVVRYLMTSHPAVIFLHGFAALLMAPVVLAVRLWLQSPSVGVGDALQTAFEEGERLNMYWPEQSGNPLRSSLVWVLQLLRPLLGVVGYTLPMWAAARLIADALRSRAEVQRPAAAEHDSDQ